MTHSSALSALIEEQLSVRGISRNELVTSLGVSRATLWRKLSAKNTPLDVDFLHSLASAIDVPYPQILRAALLDSGAITTTAELIDGLALTAVTTTGAPVDVESVVVFTDSESAGNYAELADEINTAPGGRWFQASPIMAINPTLTYTRLYTAEWSNQSRTVTTSSRRVAALPESLAADGLDPTFSITTATSEEAGIDSMITDISLCGNSADRVRDAVTAHVNELANLGRLAPPDFNARPNGFMDRMADFAYSAWRAPTESNPQPMSSETLAKLTDTGFKLTAAAAKLKDVPYQWGGGPAPRETPATRNDDQAGNIHVPNPASSSSAQPTGPSGGTSVRRRRYSEPRITGEVPPGR